MNILFHLTTFMSNQLYDYVVVFSNLLEYLEHLCRYFTEEMTHHRKKRTCLHHSDVIAHNVLLQTIKCNSHVKLIGNVAP